MKNQPSFLIKGITLGVLFALLMAFTFQIISANIPNPDPRYAECYKMQSEGLSIGCPNIASTVGFYHPEVPEYTSRAIIVNFIFYLLVFMTLLVVVNLVWHNKAKHKY
jgi:hypothetical protein